MTHEIALILSDGSGERRCARTDGQSDAVRRPPGRLVRRCHLLSGRFGELCATCTKPGRRRCDFTARIAKFCARRSGDAVLQRIEGPNANGWRTPDPFRSQRCLGRYFLRSRCSPLPVLANAGVQLRKSRRRALRCRLPLCRQAIDRLSGGVRADSASSARTSGRHTPGETALLVCG